MLNLASPADAIQDISETAPPALMKMSALMETTNAAIQLAL
jgi:hypothetical protein